MQPSSKKNAFLTLTLYHFLFESHSLQGFKDLSPTIKKETENPQTQP